MFLIFGIKQQIDINSLNSEINELEKELKDVNYEKEVLENELNKPKDEYVKDAASEQGIVDPDEKRYYGA